MLIWNLTWNMETKKTESYKHARLQSFTDIFVYVLQSRSIFSTHVFSYFLPISRYGYEIMSAEKASQRILSKHINIVFRENAQHDYNAPRKLKLKPKTLQKVKQTETLIIQKAICSDSLQSLPKPPDNHLKQIQSYLLLIIVGLT